MKSFYIFLFFLFSLCFFSNTLLANHAAGGTLTYTHLNGNQYIIQASFYRDCAGDPMPTSFTVYISSIQCGTTDSIVLTSFPVGPVWPICPSQTTCTGGTEPGFHKCNFKGTYTFPGQCQDWVMSINFGNRRSSITTIQNSASTNLYVEACLNNQNGNNYSPQFSVDPIVMACVARNRIFNPTAVDPDGDSLVYELIPARSDANTNVNYIGSYSATQPITSNPSMTFNPANGDLFMFPQALEVGVAAYRILEYRNGVLMGSVTYDMSIYMVPCPNAPPYTSGVYGTMNFTHYVLPGYFCFDIYTHDADTADTIHMYCNTSGIPGATSNVWGSPLPTGRFCWTPDSSDVRPQPYMFTVFIQDDGCPLPNYVVDTFYIIVTLDSSLITQTSNSSMLDEQLVVVPNPVRHRAEIRLGKSFINVESRFRMYDIMGHVLEDRMVMTSTIPISKGKLQPGIYFIELNNDSHRATTQIVIE